MKFLASTTILLLGFALFGSVACADPTITITRLGLDQSRRFSLFVSIAGAQVFENCELKIRASGNRGYLEHPGLGFLLYDFVGVNYSDIGSNEDPEGTRSTGWGTRTLSHKPEDKVYFRAYFSCPDFAIQSSIRSFVAPPKLPLKKVNNKRFIRHLKDREDNPV